ncbi:restriction endonuclease [Mammaliicoccus sciuri]|uniref:restriction endonuclease n=1 Tax=Mammaliicoccus sciuri TaxID=1296 RepID=UPI0037C5E4B6
MIDNKKENKEIIDFFHDNDFDITNIPTDRKYWLIRTEGGEWYEEFTNEKYISIGWNEISDSKYCENVNKEQAIKILEKNYPEKSQHTHTLNMIKRFYKEIKIGDIVMIPSEGSQTINFGEVTSDVKIVNPTETQLDEGNCPHIKRRSVNWIKKISKNNLDLKLFKMLQSRHTISNASDYSNEIDSSLYDLYVKGNNINMSIFVNKERNLSAYYLKTLTTLPWLLEEFIQDLDYDLNELESTIYIKSPGKQEIIAKGKKGAKYILYSSIAMTVLFGGNFEYKGLTVETKGALQPILDYSIDNKKEDNRHEEQIYQIKQNDHLNDLKEEVNDLKNKAELKAPNLPERLSGNDKNNADNSSDKINKKGIDQTDIY